MRTIKDLHLYSNKLKVLYVEDDTSLREETYILFQMLFDSIDCAVDGQDGLDMYNKNSYDLVISDVNMPRMNGIEMCKKIKEINPEQKVSIISAHDESGILMELIQAGADGFILKPMHMDDLVVALYPVCRDAYTQIVNIELVSELNDKNAILEDQNKKLRVSGNTIETKHQQLGTLIQEKNEYLEKSTIVQDNELDLPSPEISSEITEEVIEPKELDKEVMTDYFQEDTDDGLENVLFLPDHCADLSEIFMEIPEIISEYIENKDDANMNKISLLLARASSILVYYSPYLDLLATSFSELAVTMNTNKETFVDILNNDPQSALMLFDAVSADMERYIERFSEESLAMKNIHHIHEPTALSIQQIITLIVPPEEVEGEMDDIFDF